MLKRDSASSSGILNIEFNFKSDYSSTVSIESAPSISQKVKHYQNNLSAATSS
jgi:hypothetical protein